MTRFAKWLLVPILAFAAIRVTPAQGTGAARVVAIRGGTILTATRGTIPNGTIVLRDGRIAAVGANLAIPPGADVVDATGRFISPGIIDCHSHLASDSINENGTTVSSMTGIEDVFNPSSVDIYRDLAGGLTTANVLHGSANPIGGKNFVVKLRWGLRRATDFAFADAPPGIKLALGENPKRPGGGAGRDAPNPARFPGTRMGVEYVIRDAFLRTQAYQQSWKDYEHARKSDAAALPPRRDLQLEPLVEVLEGRRLVHAHSYRADEILMLIHVAEEFGFKIATFQHVLEGYKVAKEIAAHGAGASTFADWWGYKIEAVDAIPHNAALMARKGVLVSINSDSTEHARRLTTEAAKTMRWGGLTEDEALALVTINPARQLRIDQRVGSLEVGKDADVVIWSHHPLSSYAVADRVYIDGRQYYDREQDRARLTELAARKSTLVAAERPATPNPSENTGIAQPAAPRPSTLLPKYLARGVLAITNARIVPVVGAPIERGTIVVRDGVIAAVGARITPPAGAAILDANGGEVYPGFIDARTTLGLSEPGASGFGDVNEVVDFNPQLRAQRAYHNDSEAIPIARANGVTTVAVTPAGGLFGGQIAVMSLDGDTWEESTLSPSAGIAFQYPVIPPRAPNAPGQPRPFADQQRDREARVSLVMQQLDAARAYARAGASRTRDLVLEALVPVVEGHVPLFTRVSTERDIRAAITFAERARVRIVISGASEAALVAPLLSARNIPVILDTVLTLPTREDLTHDASYSAASVLAKAGVRFAFAAGETDDVENVRLLPYHAARSVAWGLPRERALEAMTIEAARILGVDDKIGSIEPGKIANLVISRGDPLEVQTPISHVIVGGRLVNLANRQTALYERYKERP